MAPKSPSKQQQPPQQKQTGPSLVTKQISTSTSTPTPQTQGGLQPSMSSSIKTLTPQQNVPNPSNCKPECKQMKDLFGKIDALLKKKSATHEKSTTHEMNLTKIMNSLKEEGGCKIGDKDVDPLMLLLYAHYALSRYWLIDGIKTNDDLKVIQDHLDAKVKDLSDPWCKDGDSECGTIEKKIEFTPSLDETVNMNGTYDIKWQDGDKWTYDKKNKVTPEERGKRNSLSNFLKEFTESTFNKNPRVQSPSLLDGEFTHDEFKTLEKALENFKKGSGTLATTTNGGSKPNAWPSL